MNLQIHTDFHQNSVLNTGELEPGGAVVLGLRVPLFAVLPVFTGGAVRVASLHGVTGAPRALRRPPARRRLARPQLPRRGLGRVRLDPAGQVSALQRHRARDTAGVYCEICFIRTFLQPRSSLQQAKPWYSVRQFNLNTRNFKQINM